MALLPLLAVVLVGCDRDTGGPGGQPAAAQQLVGTWKCVTVEQGVQIQITWYVRPDGTDTYTVTDGSRSAELAGTWRYSDGTLTERAADGSRAKSSIQWLDSNKFILTIIDNGSPAESGVQRHYSRL